MGINLLFISLIIITLIIVCTIWITWWNRKNTKDLIEELDDESKHHSTNLEIINKHILETNNLLETYKKVVNEKSIELNKYRDGSELAKQKGLFKSLIEITEFIDKFNFNSKNLDENTKNYLTAVKDKLEIVLNNSGIEKFDPKLNENILEIKGCSSSLETIKTRDATKVNLIANVIKSGYRFETKKDEFTVLKNAEVQVFELKE